MIGLAIAQYNQPLYQRLLIKFKHNYNQAIEPIALAADNHDFATAEQLAHTLKGVAGNIGAQQLYTLCQQLEDDATQHDIKASRLEQCRHELNRIQLSLTQLEQQAPVEQPFNVNDCKALFEQLIIDVDNYDVAAIDTIQTLLSMTHQQHYHQQLKDIMTKVEIYEFDDAATLLKEIEISL